MEIKKEDLVSSKPTFDKDKLVEAIERGDVTFSCEDTKTGERYDMVVATKAESEEDDIIKQMVGRLRSGVGCTPEYLEKVADALEEAQSDRSVWRGRMKYVLKERRDAAEKANAIEKISGLETLGVVYEMFLYAESLFCSLLENDWYEGNYKNHDVESYDYAELHLRLVLEWIRRKDPTFDFRFQTSDIVVHEHLGTPYEKLDHDTLNAARALCDWMPEADRAPKTEAYWAEKVDEEARKHGDLPEAKPSVRGETHEEFLKRMGEICKAELDGTTIKDYEIKFQLSPETLPSCFTGSARNSREFIEQFLRDHPNVKCITGFGRYCGCECAG